MMAEIAIAELQRDRAIRYQWWGKGKECGLVRAVSDTDRHVPTCL